MVFFLLGPHICLSLDPVTFTSETFLSLLLPATVIAYDHATSGLSATIATALPPCILHSAAPLTDGQPGPVTPPSLKTPASCHLQNVQHTRSSILMFYFYQHLTVGVLRSGNSRHSDNIINPRCGG